MTTQKTNVITLGLFGLSTVAYCLHSLGFHKSKKKSKINSDSDKSSNVIRPPFPQAIRAMLLRCRLAYLSTVADDAAHLSLMRFTYVNDEDDGEVIILSTQRNTKKYDLLTKQKGVAILIHDFDQFKEGNDGIHSITLNGACRILDGEKAERYRAKHLK